MKWSKNFHAEAKHMNRIESDTKVDTLYACNSCSNVYDGGCYLTITNDDKQFWTIVSNLHSSHFLTLTSQHHLDTLDEGATRLPIAVGDDHCCPTRLDQMKGTTHLAPLRPVGAARTDYDGLLGANGGIVKRGRVCLA